MGARVGLLAQSTAPRWNRVYRRCAPRGRAAPRDDRAGDLRLGDKPRVVALVEVNAPSQQTVGIECCPATPMTGMTVIVALERELDERLAIPRTVTTVELGADRDHGELAALLVIEPDERRLYQVQRVAIPDLGRRDPPCPAESLTRCLSSGRRSRRGAHGRARARGKAELARLQYGQERGADPGSDARLAVLIFEAAPSTATEADLHGRRLEQPIGDDHVPERKEHGVDEHRDVWKQLRKRRVESEDAVDIGPQEDRVPLKVLEEDELITHPVLPGRDQVALGVTESTSSLDEESLAQCVVAPHDLPDRIDDRGPERLFGCRPRKRRDDVPLVVHPGQERSPRTVEQCRIMRGEDHGSRLHEVIWWSYFPSSGRPVSIRPRRNRACGSPARGLRERSRAGGAGRAPSVLAGSGRGRGSPRRARSKPAQGAVLTRSGGAVTQCCQASSAFICMVGRRASSIGVSP